MNTPPNTITNIIWVSAGLVCAQKLADALKQVDTKKVHITKVPTVQEAVVELFRGEDPVSLIICDEKLNASIPPRDLYTAAETKEIPFLMASDEDENGAYLISPQDIDLPEKGPLRKLFSKFKIKKTEGCLPCGGRACHA